MKAPNLEVSWPENQGEDTWHRGYTGTSLPALGEPHVGVEGFLSSSRVASWRSAVGSYCDTDAFEGFPHGDAGAEHEDLFS